MTQYVYILPRRHCFKYLTQAGTIIIPIFLHEETETWRTGVVSGRVTPHAVSSTACCPSLGPSWMDAHLRGVLTSTLATSAPTSLALTLCPQPSCPFPLKRCNILLRLRMGCVTRGTAISQVRSKPHQTRVAHAPSQGAGSHWARKDPRVQPSFDQGGN